MPHAMGGMSMPGMSHMMPDGSMMAGPSMGMSMGGMPGLPIGMPAGPMAPPMPRSPGDMQEQEKIGALLAALMGLIGQQEGMPMNGPPMGGGMPMDAMMTIGGAGMPGGGMPMPGPGY